MELRLLLHPFPVPLLLGHARIDKHLLSRNIHGRGVDRVVHLFDCLEREILAGTPLQSQAGTERAREVGTYPGAGIHQPGRIEAVLVDLVAGSNCFEVAGTGRRERRDGRRVLVQVLRSGKICTLVRGCIYHEPNGDKGAVLAHRRVRNCIYLLAYSCHEPNDDNGLWVDLHWQQSSFAFLPPVPIPQPYLPAFPLTLYDQNHR